MIIHLKQRENCKTYENLNHGLWQETKAPHHPSSTTTTVASSSLLSSYLSPVSIYWCATSTFSIPISCCYTESSESVKLEIHAGIYNDTAVSHEPSSVSKLFIAEDGRRPFSDPKNSVAHHLIFSYMSLSFLHSCPTLFSSLSFAG